MFDPDDLPRDRHIHQQIRHARIGAERHRVDDRVRPNWCPIGRVTENSDNQIPIAADASRTIRSEPKGDLSNVPGRPEIHLPPFIVPIARVHKGADIAINRIAGSVAERTAVLPTIYC